MSPAAQHLKTYLQSAPVGEAARLARACKVPASHISEYAADKRGVPAKKAVILEKETFGQLRRDVLRDDWRDLWPDLIPLRSQQHHQSAAAA